MSKTWQVTLKEWREVFKNKMVLYVVILVPLLFTVLPLVILFQMQGSGEIAQEMGGMEELPGNMAAVCEGVSSAVCGQYFIVIQFLMMFLMMPVMIPATIASYSIVGEKTTRTLEPLLATPITTIELLLGKALSGVLPAVTVTWAAFGIFVTGTWFIMKNTELISLVLAPMWLVFIFVIGPLLSILGVCSAVMISSRVNDPRAAEQLSMFLILPVIGLLMAQIFGVIELSLNVTIWFAAILLILDLLMMYIATQLFQRETILTKWK